jgi:hypothetical protein
MHTQSTITEQTAQEDIKTLQELQQAKPAALRALALTTRNRFYSLALDSMANAMDAYAINDKAAMMRYVEAAKRAHARAQEDDYGKLLRVKQTAAAIDDATK